MSSLAAPRIMTKEIRNKFLYLLLRLTRYFVVVSFFAYYQESRSTLAVPGASQRIFSSVVRRSVCCLITLVC